MIEIEDTKNRMVWCDKLQRFQAYRSAAKSRCKCKVCKGIKSQAKDGLGVKLRALQE